ncbi:MAG: PEP/pyruvate-binding domain-containing protein [Candidatus Hodarchaeota archaeon]
MADHSRIIFLHDMGIESPEKYGGKAINLARLHREGFRVPDGFSVPCQWFLDFLNSLPNGQDLISILESTDDIDTILEKSEELEELGRNYEMPLDIRHEVSEAFLQLEHNIDSASVGFSIRSSANVEDSSSISFAGQAETYLCVRGVDNIISSIQKTWQSLLSPSSALYLQSMGIPLSKVRMGVVVQEMIAADIAGVMFTANVVNKDPNQIIIESTWGLGEALVSGKVIPDTYLLSKKPLQVKERKLGSKEVTSEPSAQYDTEGIVYSQTPEVRRKSFTLNDQDVVRVAKTGLEIEGKLGLYQDIEWCMRDEELIILQSRPVTTMD